MPSYDPNEVITELRSDADWNEANLFYTSNDTSVPRSLTGYTASAALTPRSGAATFNLTISLGYLSVADNAVNISVTKAQKASLALGIYDFDLVLTNPTGVRESVPSWAYEVTKGNAP